MSLFKKVGSALGSAVGSVAGAAEYRYRTLVKKENEQAAKECASKTKLSISDKVGDTAGEILEMVGPVVTTAVTAHFTGKVLGKNNPPVKKLK